MKKTENTLNNKQGQAEGESLVDILVSTPGRLVDVLQQTRGFTLRHLRFLVIDEADRLLMQSYQGWLPKVLQASHKEGEGQIVVNEHSYLKHQHHQQETGVEGVRGANQFFDDTDIRNYAIQCTTSRPLNNLRAKSSVIIDHPEPVTQLIYDLIL